MIEKMSRIANPLTIIAIFAALAEIAGTVSLGIVDSSLQSIFVWFVMLFPVLLVATFFLTLNFNPKVLYAPADFREDKSFIATVSGAFDRPSITIKRGDVAEIPTKLPQPLHSIQGETKEGLDKANAFAGFIMKRLENDMKQKKLSSIRYGMEGEGYFLLKLTIPKEVVAARRPDEIIVIVQARPDQRGVMLRAVGKDIEDTDADRFARKVYKLVSDQLTAFVDLEKLEKYEPEKESEEDSGRYS